MKPKKHWQEDFDKEFLTPEGFWNKDNNMYPFKIKSFISSQMEKLIDEIPDNIPHNSGFGTQVSIEFIKQQLRKEWLTN